MGKDQRYDMEPVYLTQGNLRAEVIRAKLEAAGIPALLRYESVGLVLGLTVDGLGQVKVLVPAELADEARAVIAIEEDVDADAAEYEEPDDFPPDL